MSVVQIRDEGPNYATKALVDFLSPLISDAIKQQQQRDANRKNNAFLGEFAKLMSGGEQQPTNLLAEQGTDGWANTLTQSGNSVLGEFDNATAGIAPQAPTQANFTQPQMTQTDFLRNFADLISNKRFSGMDTANALNLVAPLMNASEAQRVYELQKELGLELGQKGSWDDYLKAYANGVNQGLANLDTLKTMIGYAQNRQPNRQPYSFNTGATTQYGSFNQATGEYTPGGEFTNTLTPQEKLEYQKWQEGQDWEREKYGMQREDDMYKFNTGVDLQREDKEIQRQASRQMFTAGDGKLYWRNPDGSVEKVIVDGQHLDAPEGMQGSVTWTPGDTVMMGDISQQITEIGNRITQLENEYNNTTDPKKQGYLIQQMETLKQQRDQLRQQMKEYIQSRTGRRSKSQNTPEQTTPPTQPQQPTPNNNNNTEVPPSTTQNNSNTEVSRDNSPIMWRNPTTGKSYTVNEYKAMVEAVNRGDYSKDGIRTQWDLDRWIERDGYQMQSVPVEPNSIAVRRKSLQDERARQDIELQLRAGVPEAELRAQYPNYDEIMSSGKIAEQIPQEETGMGPFMTEKEKQQIDEMLQNPDKLESKPVPQDIQASNPNTFNTSGLQLASDRKGSYDVQPPFNPDGRYTTREVVQQSNENLANRRTPRQNATAQQINQRAARYEPLINSSARRYGVDPNLVKAIIMTESSFNPNAGSNKGAQGLMQLMPGTARGLGVQNSLNPAQNIEGGTKYIAQMLRMFKGDVRKALWAYNAGPGNAKKGRLPDETKAYIPRVMGFYNALRGVSQPPARRTPTRRNSRTRLANNPSVTPTEQSSLNNLNGYQRASNPNTEMQDNSPIAWQNANGQAALTQNMYEELVSRAERGEIDGFISREDVDEYLSKTRGLRNVAQTPAPEYTDGVNHTTDADTQELLNELNGLTQNESDFAEYYKRRLNRLMGYPDFYSNMMGKVIRERLRNSPSEWPSYLPPRDAFEPWNPYDFQRL